MSYISTTSASRSVPKSESAFVGEPPPLPQTVLQSGFDNNSSVALGRRAPSRRSQRSIPSPLKGTAILAAFLPLPPLVSLIYLAVGHVVLRAAHPSLYAPVPLISSVRAAAVGGAILALPLAVLLYLLLFPTKPPDPEDFFDDDEGAVGEVLVVYGTYALCGALALTIGAIAGALGTVCLPASLMLTAAEAAAAGIVGGAILCSGLGLAAAFAYFFWRRPKNPDTMSTTATTTS
ncbi:hypothetical protein C8F04DRAFT_1074151 [Mycena alexandri]|uniref:Uncharacterized protein n=1 Tax=Mycena alexandri TaxID=1745969 RepID=A0AAD6TB62_9AGAR|nr:hypothetical protein C8F04DRAFT_1074151 [Mycena alexandri]